MRADRFAATMAMIPVVFAGVVALSFRRSTLLRERCPKALSPYGMLTVSFAAVLGPLAGIAASLAGTLPARGGDVPFTEHVISTTAGGAFSVFATDMNGDGNTDVLSASPMDNKIAWYESDGGSPPSFTERVISTAAAGVFSVFATDLDGDGDIDVLSASPNDNKVAWYESDGGSPPTFTERVISTAAAGAWSVFATDVDRDGDIDVLSASGSDDKIAWYENTTRRCDDCPADFDGDGDVDAADLAVLLGSWGPCQP